MSFLVNSKIRMINDFIILLVVLFLSACGGGSGGGDGEVVFTPEPTNSDTTLPSANVVFPPESSLTNSTGITVRGTAEDNIEVSNVSVNGSFASSTDNFATWSVRVQLEDGQNTLVVEVTDSAGNSNTNAAQVTMHKKIILAEAESIAYNPNDSLAYIVDSEIGWLVSLNPNNGNLERIFSAFGPYDNLRDVEIDVAENRAILYGYSGFLHSVDLATGEGTRFETDNDLLNPFAEYMALDLESDRALTVATLGGNIVGIDLSTQIHTMVVDSEASMLNIRTVTGVDYDEQTNALVMSAFSFSPDNARIFEIDTNSGVLTTIADPLLIEDDQEYGLISDIVLDRAGNTIYDFETVTGTLFSLERDSGAIAVIAESNSANDLFLPKALTLDESNNRLFVLSLSSEAVNIIDLNDGSRSVLANISLPNNTNAFTYASDLVLDSVMNRVLVLDESLGVISVDLDSGERSIVSDFRNIGLGLDIPVEPVDIELDVDGQRVFVLDQSRERIVAVDLNDGQRSLAYDATALGDENLLSEPQGMAVDFNSNTAFILDSGAQAIIEVNLTSGDQTALAEAPSATSLLTEDLVYDGTSNTLYASAFEGTLTAISLSDSNSVSSASLFQNDRDIALDRVNNRIFTIGANQDITVYDVTTLEATTIDLRNSAVMPNPFAIDYDAASERLIVLDRKLGAIYLVDLETGEAVIISA